MYSQYKGEMHDIFGLQKKTIYRSEYYFIISSFEYMEKRVRVTYYSFISNYDGSIKLVS